MFDIDTKKTPKVYKQKDLGYKRTPTSAMMRCTFSNGEIWDVPLQIIADSRDENYKEDKEDAVKFIRKESLDEYDLEDWFSNNMDWSDVSEYAVFVPQPTVKFDYEDDFCNCEKDIYGKV